MNTILVSACDSRGLATSDTNLGGNSSLAIHTMAPGVGITSPVPNNRYLSVRGTSVATPFVTGTLALVASIFLYLSPFTLINYFRESHRSNRTIIPPLLNAEAFTIQLMERLTINRIQINRGIRNQIGKLRSYIRWSIWYYISTVGISKLLLDCARAGRVKSWSRWFPWFICKDGRSWGTLLTFPPIVHKSICVHFWNNTVSFCKKMISRRTGRVYATLQP